MFNSYLCCVLKTFEGEEKEAIKVCGNMMCTYLKWKKENARNWERDGHRSYAYYALVGLNSPFVFRFLNLYELFVHCFAVHASGPCFWSMRLLYYPHFVNHFSFLIDNKAGVNSVKQLHPTTCTAKGIGKGQQMRI